MEETFICPYCASENSLLVDVSQGQNQEFTLDCEVCCRPIVIRLKLGQNEVLVLNVDKENE